MPKIAVLMSGGVDSSVSAILLLRQGYTVMGLTMINREESVGIKAAAAAKELGIEHRVVDLRDVFNRQIIDYFCSSYERGLTPNPCVECNRSIKLGILLRHALDLGLDSVATGHYAQISSGGGRMCLRQGTDHSKDQSYFLYALNQWQLSHMLLPLGNLTKAQVKNIAREHGLLAAEEKESQEICFVPGDYRDFIRPKIQAERGMIVDIRGNVIGEHKGLAFYTVGQRKGLGLSAGKPVYVVALDQKRNCLVVDDEKHLFARECITGNNNFIQVEKLEQPQKVQVKIRYRAVPAVAVIYPLGDNRVKVIFEQPQRAVTPGQSAVYYDDDYVLGGGVIL